jgi:hypothetical protein
VSEITSDLREPGVPILPSGRRQSWPDIRPASVRLPRATESAQKVRSSKGRENRAGQRGSQQPSVEWSRRGICTCDTYVVWLALGVAVWLVTTMHRNGVIQAPANPYPGGTGPLSCGIRARRHAAPPPRQSSASGLTPFARRPELATTYRGRQSVTQSLPSDHESLERLTFDELLAITQLTNEVGSHRAQ